MRHARLLTENPRVDLEICDSNPETLGRALEELADLPGDGVGSPPAAPKAYSSFTEVIGSKPDALLIATPHTEHAGQAVSALERDIHVLCEKPMSDSLSSARKMLEASKRSEAILSIGFMLHFRPGIIRLKELIDSGELGNILQFRYHIGTYITLINSLSRYQSTLNGALFMDYAHQPDLAYWLLGKKPTAVYVLAGQGGTTELTSNPNTAFILLDFEEALSACISLNYLQMPQRDDCEIIGDRAWAHWDIQRQSLRIGRRAGVSVIEASISEETIPEIGNEMYSAEHNRFLDAIEGLSEPSSPPEEAIVSMEIIDAAMRSFQTGKRINL
jgi:predicted dehydrogenase